MTNPTGDTTQTARKLSTVAKVLMLSAVLGVLAFIYFFPFAFGVLIGVGIVVGYALSHASPKVKVTTSHTTTIKRG